MYFLLFINLLFCFKFNWIYFLYTHTYLTFNDIFIYTFNRIRLGVAGPERPQYLRRREHLGSYQPGREIRHHLWFFKVGHPALAQRPG